VWAEAATWLGTFDEAVLTVLGADGYPVSVRVDPRTYDAATGLMPAPLPDELGALEAGPANLLCHYHDERMWKIRTVHVKGRLEKRDGAWVFASTSFSAPSRLQVFSFVTGARTSAQKYLDKRGLKRPAVNWTAIKDIQRRAKESGAG
jgi:hypothetical protein